MKRFATALLALSFTASAAIAQAPIDPSVMVNFSNAPGLKTGGTGYGGEGGGYVASFSVDFPAPTGTQSFNDYLLWCIDAHRGINTPSTKEYQFFSVQSFAASNFGAVNGYNPNLSDMNRIASLVNDLSTNWTTLSSSQRSDLQGSIWATFEGLSNYPTTNTPVLGGDPYFDSTQWYVLYNGENQTFLVKVAEPGTMLLLAVGLGGLLFMAMRRKIA